MTLGGRVIVLVDRFCLSPGEDFVMPFKDTGRGTFVGEAREQHSPRPVP